MRRYECQVVIIAMKRIKDRDSGMGLQNSHEDVPAYEAFLPVEQSDLICRTGGTALK